MSPGERPPAERPSLPAKKTFLWALIVSVGLSACLGIVAILSGELGWIQLRILLTTMTIAASSICGLACGAYWSTGRGRVLPQLGTALTLLAGALIVAGLWLRIGSAEYWKAAASVSVYSVACAHLALLSMARLAQGFRWSLMAAHAAILGVASLIVLMILLEPREEGMFRLLGVAAILDGAISIMIPIFHRLSKKVVAGEVSGLARVPVPAESAQPEGDQRSALDQEIATLKARLAELERLKQQGV